MNQLLNLRNIPDIISLTELRYKSDLLLRKLLEEEKPLILVKRSQKIGLIIPIDKDLGKARPEHALKIKAYSLGAPLKIKRARIYNQRLKEKLIADDSL